MIEVKEVISKERKLGREKKLSKDVLLKSRFKLIKDKDKIVKVVDFIASSIPDDHK